VCQSVGTLPLIRLGDQVCSVLAQRLHSHVPLQGLPPNINYVGSISSE